MLQPSSLGPNPILHLFKRQIGDNSYNFRIKLFKEKLKIGRNLFKNDLKAHFGCVNAIEFSRDGEYLVSGGDDRRVLLWNLNKSMYGGFAPRAMEKHHMSNIFCLGLDSLNTKIFSGGNDDTVIIHDITTGQPVDVFFHNKPVYGLSVDPTNDNLFTTAGDDGRTLLFDSRVGSEVQCIARYRSAFHAVMFHPHDGGFVITANAKEGAAFWDLRTPKIPSLRFGGDKAAQSCMSVRFNSNGSQILALRRRLPPILYTPTSEEPICQFYNPDYYNSCTMKSCCFAGNFDEYVLSGSDDFNLYVWRVGDADPDGTHQWVDTNQMILFGHRSIVNQVRFNQQKCLLASSGVEKIIKMWTPLELNDWSGSLTDEIQGSENPRDVFSHEEYISLVQSSGSNMTHDYSNQNTTEDSRMMAFFDYLVQQEIEGWNSFSSDQLSEEHTSANSTRQDSSQSSDDQTAITSIVRTRNTRDHNMRRGDMGSRANYRNRISYLISTKRNSLKRLALKGTGTRIQRRIKTKYGARQNKRQPPRITRRNSNTKRIRRGSTNKYSKRPVSCEQTSDSEVPKKMRKRRLQHMNITSYRSFRRKVKTPLSSTSNTSTRAADYSASSSSDYDDDEDEDRPTTSKFSMQNNDRNDSTSNNLILDMNTPSTSTGITSNGKGFLFRIAAANARDSDDEQSIPDNPSSPDNMVRVIRSPLNGSSRNFSTHPISDDEGLNNNNINHNYHPYMNNVNNNNLNNNHSYPLNNNHSNNRQHNHQTNITNASIPINNHHNNNNNNNNNRRNHEYVYSSQSNSRLSSSYQEDDGSTSNDSFVEYYNKKRKLRYINYSSSNNHNNNNEDNQNSNDSTTSSKKEEQEGTTAESAGRSCIISNVATHDTNNNDSTINGNNNNISDDMITPQKSNDRDLINETPDSGITTAPGSSSGGSVNANGGASRNNNITSILFQQKLSKVRKNYRQSFVDDYDDDSDSD